MYLAGRLPPIVFQHTQHTHTCGVPILCASTVLRQRIASVAPVYHLCIAGVAQDVYSLIGFSY
jgi:hypothetical protein